MATARAKKTKIQKGRDQVIQSLRTVNCKAIDLAEDLIEGTVATGAKYQKIAAGAIKKSEPIIEKQVDLVFDSVELFFEQFQNNSTRFQKLLGIEKQVDKASAQIGKIVKTVSGRVEEGFEEAEKVIKKNIKKGKGEASKATKTVKAQARKTTKVVAKKAKATPARKTTKRRGRPSTKK